MLLCVAYFCCEIPSGVRQYVDFLGFLFFSPRAVVASGDGRWSPSVKGSSAIEVDAADPSFIHLRIFSMKYSKVTD